MGEINKKKKDIPSVTDEHASGTFQQRLKRLKTGAQLAELSKIGSSGDLLMSSLNN